MAASDQPQYAPGITLRSAAACLCAMLVMGIQVQYVEVILADSSAAAEQSLPLPAISTLLVLLAAAGALYALRRWSILTRAEILCVLFSMLIAAPIMTQGMWHRFIGLIASTPRTNSFSYMDAYSDKLWPHGPNLLEGAFAQPASPADVPSPGRRPTWQEMDWNEGQRATVPVLANEKADEVSTLSLVLPMQTTGRPGVVPGEPYLVSFLAKAEKLTPDSFYFVRLYRDQETTYDEIITAREQKTITFVQRAGFVRQGVYGVVVPPETTQQLRLEYGLSGVGTLALWDPKCFNVAALEGVYKGRTIIRQSEYDQLPPNGRANLIVKPDRMWSVAGLQFILAGYIPIRDWLQTIIAWGTPVLLLLLGTLAVNVVMRRQWAESERYPFPLFQIPRALLGEEDEGAAPAFARVWRNPWLWAGFGLALVWGLLKGWNFYNPRVPNLDATISLRQYLSDPGWGGMWDKDFNLSAILLSLCLFFELGVLVSLVLGFFLFRALFWLGEAEGLTVYTGYPFRYEQAVGAYLGYALVVLFFTRKYLWRVAQSVARGDAAASRGEALSYRVALGLLALVFVGFAAWAKWLGVSQSAVLIYFGFLVVIGFVATKFRAECGLPVGYFTPYSAMLFVSLVGGFSVFGADGMLVCLIASGFLTVSVFFFIPGVQLELLEFGRRYRVQPRHLVWTVLLGIAGGVLIGGWVFLSNAYAIGGQNIKYQWSFGQDWYFRGAYRPQLATATSDYVRNRNQAEHRAALTAKEQALAAQPASPELAAVRTELTEMDRKALEAKKARRMEPATWAYLLAGGVTIILATLRQLFAGFWVHPIGFVLGSAHMLEWAWGSVFLAFVIRLVVLLLGGAATVKRKLMPFAVGLFVGGLVSVAVFVVISIYLKAHGVELTYGRLP